jgi:hypothetical protein
MEEAFEEGQGSHRAVESVMMWTRRQIPTFRRKKMGAVCFSEMLVSIYESTRRHNPEEQHRHLHRRDNLKFLIVKLYSRQQTRVLNAVDWIKCILLYDHTKCKSEIFAPL